MSSFSCSSATAPTPFEHFAAGRLDETFLGLVLRRYRANELAGLPPWQPGTPVSGLLIFAPPGLGIGAEVLHLAFLARVASQLQGVMVAIDQRLVHLVQDSLLPAKVVAFDDMNGAGFAQSFARTSQATLLAAGHIARLLHGNFSRESKFVRPSPSATPVVRAHKRIGISWKTSNPKWEGRRDFDLRRLLAIAAGDGREVVSLQHGCTNEERALLLANGVSGVDCDPVTSFDWLVTAVNEVDLVLSIDNSVCLVAGGVGTPCFLLPTAIRSWIWSGEGSNQFWFPNVEVLPEKLLEDPQLDDIIRRRMLSRLA